MGGTIEGKLGVFWLCHGAFLKGIDNIELEYSS
jgi:hypothetical protein